MNNEILSIGSRRELFVDHLLIDHLDNMHLKLHEPVSGGVALRIDQPWEGKGNFGISVIELDGRLLMYYRGWALGDADDFNGVACVAESRDNGATWTKPVLNLVKRPDWPDNNIIATEISRVVAWKGGPDVSQLTGRPVRLRFAMKDADLFALRFRKGNAI